jgi:hypothetical protein
MMLSDSHYDCSQRALNGVCIDTIAIEAVPCSLHPQERSPVNHHDPAETAHLGFTLNVVIAVRDV